MSIVYVIYSVYYMLYVRHMWINVEFYLVYTWELVGKKSKYGLEFNFKQFLVMPKYVQILHTSTC